MQASPLLPAIITAPPVHAAPNPRSSTIPDTQVSMGMLPPPTLFLLLVPVCSMSLHDVWYISFADFLSTFGSSCNPVATT